MAAEISEALKRELTIVELEAEFRDNKPLGKPRKPWLLMTIIGLFLLSALICWLADHRALALISLLVCVFQLVDYQWSKQANRLYDCGSQIIDYYKKKCQS